MLTLTLFAMLQIPMGGITGGTSVPPPAPAQQPILLVAGFPIVLEPNNPIVLE